MPNGTYGGVRGMETIVGQKTFVSQPTRIFEHQAATYCSRRFRDVCYGLLLK